MDIVRSGYPGIQEPYGIRKAGRTALLSQLRENLPEPGPEAPSLSYLNHMQKGLDRVNEPRYRDTLDSLFQLSPDDRMIERAAQPQKYDSTAGKKIKNDYRHLYGKIKREAAEAAMIINAMGPGTHENQGRDGNTTITIRPEKAGHYTITLNCPEKGQKRISYSPHDPGNIDIEIRDGDHHQESLSRCGSDLSVSREGITEYFSLHGPGVVARERKGPGREDYITRKAGVDGSMITSNLLYNDENGMPVFETKRTPPLYSDKITGMVLEEVLQNSVSITRRDMEGIFSAIEAKKGSLSFEDCCTIERFIITQWDRLDGSLKQSCLEAQDKAGSSGDREKTATPSGGPAETGIAMLDRLVLASQLVQAGGSADENDRTIVAKRLAALPLDTLKKLHAAGVRIIACRGSVTDYRTDLKGICPRGWPEGKSWDNVKGLCSGQEVVIAVIGHGTMRGPHVPETGEGHGSDDVVAHEAGHALDNISAKGSRDPFFLEARNKDYSTLSDYEKQPPPAGPEETFAESLALYVNSPITMYFRRPHLFQYFKARNSG